MITTFMNSNRYNWSIFIFINFIKDGIISYDFFINNKELFEVDNYNKIMKKMKLFKDEGINYRLFINDY